MAGERSPAPFLSAGAGGSPGGGDKPAPWTHHIKRSTAEQSSGKTRPERRSEIDWGRFRQSVGVGALEDPPSRAFSFFKVHREAYARTLTSWRIWISPISLVAWRGVNPNRSSSSGPRTSPHIGVEDVAFSSFLFLSETISSARREGRGPDQPARFPSLASQAVHAVG